MQITHYGLPNSSETQLSEADVMARICTLMNRNDYRICIINVEFRNKNVFL
jgi:hypothetical protein